MNQALLTGLRSGYLFGSLTDEELEALMAVCKPGFYSKNNYLFRLDEKAEHTFLVISGKVVVYRWTPEGEEKQFHTIVPGQLVAEASMFMSHGSYPMNARAEEDTHTYAIPRKALQQLCVDHPKVALKLLESLSTRMFSLVNRVDQLSGNSAGRRLAGWIVERCSGQRMPVTLSFSRQQLAVQLGIAPETLSRLLKKYRSAGFISGLRGRYQVLDLNGLMAIEHLPVRSA